MNKYIISTLIALTVGCGPEFDDTLLQETDQGGAGGGAPTAPPSPSRPRSFDGDELYGVIDLDADVDKGFGVTTVIGVGFQAKNGSNCISDPRIPGITFGCDAQSVRMRTRAEAINASSGSYCGDDSPTIAQGSYKPCFVPNTAGRELWKYKIVTDSCPGDLRAGVRKGVTEFNSMMSRVGLPWKFTEVSSGENVTFYCTNNEGQPAEVYATAYYWNPNTTKTPELALASTFSNCGVGSTNFMNRTHKLYQFHFAAVPINHESVLADYGTEGSCWRQKPASMQGWEWLQLNMAGITIHELGHVIGLHHYTNSFDDIMRPEVDCDAFTIVGKTFESRILNAISRYDSIRELNSPVNAYDADLECVGIRGRTPRDP